MSGFHRFGISKIKAASFALAGLAGLAACDQGPSAPYDFYDGRSQSRIYLLPDQGFEVAPPIGSGGAEYWCAASEFARRGLGAGWQQPIYVQRGLAHGRVSGRIDTVEFTLKPVQHATQQPKVTSLFNFEPGIQRTVSSAESACRDMEPFIIF